MSAASPSILVFAYHDVGHECLDVLIRRGLRIAGVFTHRDNPKENIWFKSVARLAQHHGLPVQTPDSVNTPEWIERIRALAPEIIFSFYYRDMIGQPILDVPRLGAFNMHGSLLPRYRGRAPINWAVIHGERETGATLHYMVKRADAGDIVDQEPVAIGARETARDVFVHVTAAARRVLERSLDAIVRGAAPRTPQDESRATYFGGRQPEDGRIDWTRSAVEIFNLIRGVTHPYPGAFTQAHDRLLRVWWARPQPHAGGIPGQILSTQPLCVATGNGCLELVRVQWQDQAEEDATATHGLLAGQCFDASSYPAVRRRTV